MRSFPLLEYLNRRLPGLFNGWRPWISRQQQKRGQERWRRTFQTTPSMTCWFCRRTWSSRACRGTGKSFAIERLAESSAAGTGRKLLRFGNQPFAVQVMHPSSSYEDFIEGIRPRSSSGAGGTEWFDAPVGTSSDFVVEDGFFLRVCAAAASRPDRDVLVLLDEFNRCNVPSVLGDLLLTLEASRRATYVGGDQRGATAQDWRTAVPVQLPYSGRLSSFRTTSTSSRPSTPRTDRWRRSMRRSDAALLSTALSPSSTGSWEKRQLSSRSVRTSFGMRSGSLSESMPFFCVPASGGRVARSVVPVRPMSLTAGDRRWPCRGPAGSSVAVQRCSAVG